MLTPWEGLLEHLNHPEKKTIIICICHNLVFLDMTIFIEVFGAHETLICRMIYLCQIFRTNYITQRNLKKPSIHCICTH